MYKSSSDNFLTFHYMIILYSFYMISRIKYLPFFLGLIAGLMLSVLISKDAFKGGAGVVTLFEPGIIHPLLAMLGGFSADLLHTILNRLVEAVESLFRGGSKNVVAYQLQEEKSRLVTAQLNLICPGHYLFVRLVGASCQDHRHKRNQ